MIAWQHFHRASLRGKQNHSRVSFGSDILDNRFLDGTLWEQLDATMDALRGYLQVRQEIRSTAPTVEGLQPGHEGPIPRYL